MINLGSKQFIFQIVRKIFKYLCSLDLLIWKCNLFIYLFIELILLITKNNTNKNMEQKLGYIYLIKMVTDENYQITELKYV